MDLKQIEYIIEIVKEKNITHAAKKLFISQSALNQQLLKLESELGAQIFNRNRGGWKLTKVGEIYVENAIKILEIKKNAYNMIYDYVENKKRKLIIGLTPGRGIELFTSIFEEFQSLYPYLTIIPIELSVYQQQKKIANGEIDLGFMTLSKDQRTDDNYVLIYSEEMVFITSKNHSFNKDKKSLKPIELNDFCNEPFVFMNENSTNRDLINNIFEEARIKPHILFETTFTSSIIKAVESSLCCSVVPHYYAKKSIQSLSYFPIKGNPSWDVVVSYKKGTYLSKACKTFIELTKAYFNFTLDL
ncbi:LysR family transcriptional regulator [Cetobacterium somerae]|nr:LysR family transcriptional regulator [Cetobacterium somerae]